MTSTSNRPVTFSPTLSGGALSTVGGPQNSGVSSRIVQKLAIEGRCKADSQGASLRLFLKIVLPLDGLIPGSSIPLFPEENVRIVTSKVQPLDSASTPYAFSSSAVPLLHRAARALNLPPRSSKSYYTFLGIPPPPQPAVSPSDPTGPRRSSGITPLPVSVTGEINVSNFHICFILPKILPTRGAVLADNDVEHVTPRKSGRRASFGERNTILFMAGVEIFVPYVSRPPKAPYLLTLPLPRCLSNHIKLRIMPPDNLSDGQEAAPWDLSSDPMVSYKASHGSRSTTYEQLADDEKSLSDSVDSTSSTGSSSGVQGNFPSSDRIHIRWAPPMHKDQGFGILADGRRRVGVEEASGLLRCTVLGQDEEERTKLHLEYEGTCKGLWFPGVATQVGLDVVLDGKGRSLAWTDENQHWEVSGGTGLTGYDSEVPNLPAVESLKDHSPAIPHSGIQPPRQSSYSAPSLLRAPLPNNSMLPDYSFETTPSPTISMINSAGSPYFASAISSGIIQNRPPAHPITLFLNIGELSPPPRNEFSFKIVGTVLLGPARDDSADDDALVLPVFRVLPAEKDRAEFIVTSEMQGDVEIILPQDRRQSGSRMPLRKRMLRLNSEIRAEDGVSVVLSSPRVFSTNATPMPQRRTITAMPNGSPIRSRHVRLQTPSSVASLPVLTSAYPIPWVRAQVTILPLSKRHSHAIQFTVPTMAANGGILSFGVCLPSFLTNEKGSNIDVVSATADGRNLQVEVFPRIPLVDEEKQDLETFEKALQLIDFDTEDNDNHEEIGDLTLRDIVSWIQVSVPEDGPVGNLDIHYLVGRDQRLKNSWRADGESLSILLPSFHVGVGTYTVEFHTPFGHKTPTLLSNFHQYDERQLSHFRLPGYFYPRVRAQLERIKNPAPTLPWRSLVATGWLMRRTIEALPPLASMIMLWMVFTIREDVRDLRLFSKVSGTSWAAESIATDNYGHYPANPGDPTQATFTPEGAPLANSATSNEMAVFRHVFQLMPAIPLALLQRLDWGTVYDALFSSMEKLMNVVKYVIHFPAPP